MSERTEWYPKYVQPVHSGVYVKHNTTAGVKFFARFESRIVFGQRIGLWFMGSLNYDEARLEDTPVPFGFPEWPWQGLKEPA
jgi:hypothetical protein